MLDLTMLVMGVFVCIDCVSWEEEGHDGRTILVGKERHNYRQHDTATAPPSPSDYLQYRPIPKESGQRVYRQGWRKSTRSALDANEHESTVTQFDSVRASTVNRSAYLSRLNPCLVLCLVNSWRLH